MTNEQIAELKRIVEGAPDGATHVDVDSDFWIIGEHHSEQCVLLYKDGLEQDYCEPNVHINALGDLRTIIDQHEEIERLRGLVSDVFLDNHRHGHTATETLNAIQEHVEKGESDE